MAEFVRNGVVLIAGRHGASGIVAFLQRPGVEVNRAVLVVGDVVIVVVIRESRFLKRGVPALHDRNGGVDRRFNLRSGGRIHAHGSR